MRSAKFTAPEKEVEKTKEGQLDADAFNKKRMAKFEDAPTAYTERPALQRGNIPMTRSRAVTEVSGPGRSRGAAMDGTAIRVMIEKQFNPLRNGPVFTGRKCQTFFTITFIGAFPVPDGSLHGRGTSSCGTGHLRLQGQSVARRFRRQFQFEYP
jgi:hypothetical protein